MILELLKHLVAALKSPRTTIFATAVEWEIWYWIFPHLRGERNRGYAFTTDTEMNAIADFAELRQCLDMLDRQTRQMPKGYGLAFRYVMHRDLNRRLYRYANLAQWRISPKLRVAKYV